MVSVAIWWNPPDQTANWLRVFEKSELTGKAHGHWVYAKPAASGKSVCFGRRNGAEQAGAKDSNEFEP